LKTRMMSAKCRRTEGFIGSPRKVQFKFKEMASQKTLDHHAAVTDLIPDRMASAAELGNG